MHGDIVQNNPYNEKPSTDLIRCIPKKCVRKLKNSKNIWNSKTSPNDRCRSDAMCCALEKNNKILIIIQIMEKLICIQIHLLKICLE